MADEKDLPKKEEKTEDAPKKQEKKPKQKKKSKTAKPAKTLQPLNLVNVVKKAVVQVKYEEIGSWLMTHNTPLFYAHKNGFSVVDKKFIDKHPNLKKELDKMVKKINKKRAKSQKAGKPIKKQEDLGYIS
ncbi:hypothetical protein GF374_01420 [Candidatus Woesearchaeota archaeon]|nr:hypothetical protein [Candidatus Woesearchaeota archaeon]